MPQWDVRRDHLILEISWYLPKISLQGANELICPFSPQAEACKSVDYAFKKCPNGMYAEIKYDGERVQVHKQGDSFSYFSRSLKPVLPHKVRATDDTQWLIFFWWHCLPSSLQYKTHLRRQWNCRSLRWSWSIACRRCSDYIFMIDLKPGFDWLGKDNGNMRRESFQFWD